MCGHVHKQKVYMCRNKHTVTCIVYYYSAYWSTLSLAHTNEGNCIIIYLIIMELGRIFVRTNLWNCSKILQWTGTKLLSAVWGVTSTGISIVSLQNEGFPMFSLCLTTGRHLCFTEKLRNSRSIRLFANSSLSNAATAFSLPSQFHVCACEEFEGHEIVGVWHLV